MVPARYPWTWPGTLCGRVLVSSEAVLAGYIGWVLPDGEQITPCLWDSVCMSVDPGTVETSLYGKRFMMDLSGLAINEEAIT